MIKLYDISLNPVAILQNAFNIGYTKKMNEIWTAKFSMPSDDPKNTECTAFRLVEIFDNGERVDLFRILPSKLQKNADGLIIEYQCEHVLATLLDDVLFQYHQVTNENHWYIFNYILTKQSVARWKRGTVEFSDLYSYKWENENLLNALFSSTKLISEEFIWTWDTSSYPWTLNLVEPETDVSAYVRYRKNLIGVEKDEDPTCLKTRLYCLGYGEGDNQLTVSGVNSGLPYITADTASSYGIIADFYIDKKEENASMLLTKASVALQLIKVPKITYSVNAADIYQITSESIDKFDAGAKIEVFDDESNINFIARVVGVEKHDITGNPGDIKLEISNKVLNITDAIASTQNKQRINDVYAQGSVNVDLNDYQDNCDNLHSAVMQFYIPNECVRLNKCLLSYSTSKYRAYSIDFGIYEFAHMPSEISITVDGNVMSGVTALSGSDIDIIPYLATTDGKITRGAFHTVIISPNTTGSNPLGLARITATVIKQVFLQSRGGGDY